MAGAVGRRWAAWLVAGVSLANPALLAAQPQAGKEPPPAFALTTTAGQTLLGTWATLGADGAVELAGDQATQVKAGEWLTLRRSKAPLPPPPRGPHLVLTTGDRIPLADKAEVKIVGNQLRCQVADSLRAKNGTLEFPLSRVMLIWLGGPGDVEDPVQLLRQLLAGSRPKDLVLMRNGDKVAGNVQALDSASACTAEVGKKQVELPWADIGVIAFSTELLAVKPPAGLYYHLVLADGTRLSVLSPSLAKGAAVLAFKTLFGTPVDVPVKHIIALDVRQGAAVYLSDLKARKFEHTPFVGTSWPLVLDGSVAGGELRLAGSTFDKGLGMHAQSRVVYDLDGQYRWLEALVGLDPEHGKKGRVHIRVLVDGKEKDIGWKKELTASDGPLAIRVDVAKGRELTLEVLFGSLGDVQAHVNWADARLVK
jgi:hypothetical protein